MSSSIGYVWLPHEKFVWIPARAKFEDPVLKTFTYETIDGEDVEFKEGKLDREKLERVSDISMTSELDNLVNLDDFSEGAVLHQLRKRYASDKIYTSISTILVSINPYKLLPIYTSATVEKYREDYTNMSPHVFHIAADAYKRLLDECKNQAVIISGESGAGKTEATKTVLQYLSEVAGSANNVEQQILMSNPVLEAFGNAKTLRNNNSSRFGKWMEVFFAIGGRICAAQVVNYLLEKSRVVRQTEGERNYHIFYQLLSGLPDEDKKRLYLSKAQDFHYVNQSGCYEIVGANDANDFKNMLRALRNLNFEEDEIQGLFSILASVLVLGNMKIDSNKSKEGTEIKDTVHLEKVAKVLQVNATTLATALTFRSVTIRGSVSMIPLKLDEAGDSRDALAKALYGQMFNWLVMRINKTLYTNPPKDALTIGILDIFGFEIFETNLFEQFCINYANEKLQQHFNEYIFKVEQAEYKKEQVDVAFIEFIDNIECLNLIELKATGILAMLDEEVSMPKGSDKNFVSKLHKRYAEDSKNPFYDQIRRKPEVFLIKHYAGAVEYNSPGMLEKNRDKLHDSLRELVMQSEVKLIRNIFKLEGSAESHAEKKGEKSAGGGGAKARRGGAAAARAGTMKGGAGAGGAAAAPKAKTLGSQFKDQLAALMTTLHAANPHYIRCIKPNPSKIPNEFESQMILRQMRYAGLFEAIRIRRAGYPFRVAHEEFALRYRICLKGGDLKTLISMDAKKDYKEQAHYVLKKLQEPSNEREPTLFLEKKEFAVGLTKVLMRNSQRIILTKLRDAALTVMVLKIQAYTRGNQARTFYKKLKAFAQVLQKSIAARVIEDLKKVLVDAEEGGFQLFMLRRATDVLKYLEEEKRVAEIMIGCLNEYKANPWAVGLLEPLESGLFQAHKLKERFEKEDVTPYFKEIVAQCEAAKADVIRKHKAREQLKLAYQLESIPDLEAAITEAKAADLKPEEWAEAQKLLDHLKWEVKVIQECEDATAIVEAGSDQPKLEDLEAKIKVAETVTPDQKRKDIIAAAKTALKGGWFNIAKNQMIEASHDLKNHMPDHTVITPVEELPIPPLDKKINEELLPKLSTLLYMDVVSQVQGFLGEQVKKRKDFQKQAHYDFLHKTIKDAEEEGAKQLPDHTIDTPAAQLPLPLLETKIRDLIIPNLQKVGLQEFCEPAVAFLEQQVKVREAALKEAHLKHLQATIKLAEAEHAKYLPDWKYDYVPKDLPPHEKTIAEEILPKLEKLAFTAIIQAAKDHLDAQQLAREAALKASHYSHLQAVIESAKTDGAKYMPTWEKDDVPSTLPPEEQKIKGEILPKLEKLGYREFVDIALAFLEAQQRGREAESLRIKHEKEEAERKRREEEERKKREEERLKREEEERRQREEERRRREEEERRRVAEERRLEEERLAKERANIAAAERKRLEEEDRKRREAEDTKRKKEAEERAKKEEEEAKARAEKERREAEEKARLSQARATEEERKLLNDLDRKRKEAEAKQSVLSKQAQQNQVAEEEARKKAEEDAAKLSAAIEEKERQQRLVEEEFQRKKREEAEVHAKAALDKKVRRAPPPPPADHIGGLPPPPPEDTFDMPPPPPPEEMELPPPPPPEDDGSEKRMAELDAATKTRSLTLITDLLKICDDHGDNTRSVRVARNLKEVLTEERKIVQSLKKCIKELNTPPLKSLLREAANLGLENAIIQEARNLCYGMTKPELLTRRVQLALQNKDAEKLKLLLEEAKEEGIENDDIEHAKDFVAMQLDMGDWNSRMRVARSRTVSGITASQASAYKQFLEMKGMYPLRKFVNLRREGNYAKREYFKKKDLKKKRLVWQKEDVPRSLVKLSTAHCGGVKKSKLVKKIAIQIFKNIRGYMGDQYHAYPVTLAYEVVNTGVNEELLRDEIFCQLIKQTSKNPSIDSCLLGWKLMYLCVSTFWPSDELRPCVLSHLAAHAPSKITQKEFGFNTEAELAYHCYVAMDETSPPAGEPPSMQDIEKITNGTLGAIKSFYAVQIESKDEEKEGPDGATDDLPPGDDAPLPPDAEDEGAEPPVDDIADGPPPPDAGPVVSGFTAKKAAGFRAPGQK